MATMLTVEWWRCTQTGLFHAFPVRGFSSLCSYFGWREAMERDDDSRYRCVMCENRAVSR
jgi:hypothetical protein